MTKNQQQRTRENDRALRTLYFDENGSRVPAPIEPSAPPEGNRDIWRNIAAALSERS